MLQAELQALRDVAQQQLDLVQAEARLLRAGRSGTAGVGRDEQAWIVPGPFSSAAFGHPSWQTARASPRPPERIVASRVVEATSTSTAEQATATLPQEPPPPRASSKRPRADSPPPATEVAARVTARADELDSPGPDSATAVERLSSALPAPAVTPAPAPLLRRSFSGAGPSPVSLVSLPLRPGDEEL